MKKLLVGAVPAALVALAIAAAPVFAVETFTFDFSDDITTGVAGLITAAAAMVAVVLGVAVTIRLVPKGARLALKYLGLIK